MARLPDRSTWTLGLAALSLVFVTIIALLVRLVDPLSSPVLPMEDPFRHMGLTRQYLRAGHFGDLETMDAYAPGLHAFMAAVWVFTGAELYPMFRFGPVLLGALGALGVGLLLWRNLGPLPAFFGSLAYAVAPLLVHFTTAMRPFVLDLALVPFLVYAILEVARGRLRWSVVSGLMLLFFVYAYPWFLALLLPVLAVFLVMSLISRPRGEGRVDLRGLALLVAQSGIALGVTMTGGGGITFPIDDILPAFMDRTGMPWIVMGASVVPLVLLLVFARIPRWWADRPHHRVPFWPRMLLSALVAAALLVVTAVAVRRGMPLWVDLPQGYGWPILTLGAIGLLLVPLRAGRVGLFAAAWVAVAYPLSVLDLHEFEWLPHRMSVFLGLGIALLVGVAVDGFARVARSAAQWVQRSSRRSLVQVAAAGLPLLLVAAPVSGAVYWGTPESHGWYRIHGECELAALHEVAQEFNGDPDAVMLTGSWHSWLALTGFVDDSSNLWVGHWWMREYDWHHEKWLKRQEEAGAPLYLLVDPNTHDLVDNLSFLDGEPWQVYASWCPDGDGQAKVVMYTSDAPPWGREPG